MAARRCPIWTIETRRDYERKTPRYPGDLTDSEWALVAPSIPPAKRGGRKRETNLRKVMDGVLYVLENGCQWRAPRKDLPPKSTVHDYFMLWEFDGTLERLHHELYVKTRDLEGREASPSAAVIDSQSVKSAEKGGLDRPVPPINSVRRRNPWIPDQFQSMRTMRTRTANPCKLPRSLGRME